MADLSIPSLQREWERLRLRYGFSGTPPGLERLLLATRRRQVRLRHLRAQVSELQSEIEVLEREVVGLDKTARLLLNESIAEIKVEHGPSWSPVAMLGFRVWEVRDGGFHGYREHWEHRSLKAYCGTTRSHDDVPHTEGQCGDPPCGIYAAKDVAELLGAHQGARIDTLAVGLVGMTGKVVEHERGWRGEETTVLALAFSRQGSLYTTDDPDEIELLFQGIGLTTAVDGQRAPMPSSPLRRAFVSYMRHQAKEKTQWISESPNEL